MSVVPTVSADGIGVIAAGQLNAYVISTLNTAVLRTVVGQPGMTCYLQGINVPNDGGQGWYYWNYASVAPDDNYNVIVPNGVVLGAWIRQAVIVTNAAPAFSVYANSNQSVTTGTWTKVQLNTKEFDTAAAFDATTQYQFTPKTAGYYQMNGALGVAATSGTQAQIAIYKNGTAIKNGNGPTLSTGYFSANSCVVSALIYMNGATDYLELFGYVAGTGPSFQSGAATTYFGGSLTRNQ